MGLLNRRQKKKFKVSPPPETSEAREKNILSVIFLISGACAFALPMMVMGDTKNPVGTGVQVLISTMMYLLAWLLGRHYGSAIAGSDDKQLFGYMPLTPRGYFQGNARRIRRQLILMLALVPLTGTLALLLLTLDVQTFSIDHLLILCAVQTVVVWLAFLVPLFEALTGERWTGFYFFPRLLNCAVARWPLIFPVGMIAFIAFMFVLNHKPDWADTIARETANVYAAASPAGQLLLLLASPVAGILQLYEYAGQQVAPLMWVSLWFLALAGYLSWRIWQATGKPIQQIDEDIYQEWVVHRSRYEEIQQYNAWFQQVYEQSQLPQNIMVDEDEYIAALHPPDVTAPPAGESEEPPATSPPPDQSTLDETGEQEEQADTDAAGRQFEMHRAMIESFVLPYDETLSPEAQAVRHYQFWVHPRQWPLLLLVKIMAAIILLAWAVGILTRTSFGKSYNADILWQLSAVVLLWAGALVANTLHTQRMSWLNIHFSIYPLQFRKLRKEAVRWADVANWILIDLGAATAAVLAMGLPWDSWFVCFGFMALIRAEFYFNPVAYANLQPKVSGMQAVIADSPAIVAVFLPIVLWGGSYFFYPPLDAEGRILKGPMGVNIHEALVPGMFDLRIGGSALLVSAIAVGISWFRIVWLRWKFGDQTVTVPHYVPESLEIEKTASSGNSKPAGTKYKKVSIWRLVLFVVLCISLVALLEYFEQRLNEQIVSATTYRFTSQYAEADLGFQ